MLALVAIAVLALVVGVIVGIGSGPSYTRALAGEFATAWIRGEYRKMYGDIDAGSRRSISASAFAALYREASELATVTSVHAGHVRERAGGSMVVPIRMQTRMFGTLHSSFTIPFRGTGEAARIAWSRSLTFPGLRPGERLARHTWLPARAALLTRDGSLLASGPATSSGERASPLGAAASAIVGSVGPIPTEESTQLQAEGVPPNAIVGTTGLERVFDSRLRGKPGGVLLAGTRPIARAAEHVGENVRTSISAAVQTAAATALGAQYGGVVALQPSTGQILGIAGIGIDDLQPPGSTFKIITVTGVLQYGVAHPDTVFPYATSTTLDGVQLRNAESESCGGSLILSFAVSCNSVFAPLGVRLGAARLVTTAERFGFNRNPGLPGAAESTIPKANEIQGELALGSTAIGQGRALASPLEMAIAAATIADHGRRPLPTYSPGGRVTHVQATSRAIAREVESMMEAVVREGTGTAAAIPGVSVAGKTGTAEIGSPTSCSPAESTAGSGGGSSGGGETAGGCEKSAAAKAAETDAWFAAFAPTQAPRIAVGVLMVHDGFGGATAAPVAKAVLEAGLRPL